MNLFVSQTELAQLPALPPGALETWILCAVVLVPAAAWLTGLLTRKPREKASARQYVTQEDFNQFNAAVRQEMNGLRDRIDARFLGLMDKLDQLKSELLGAEERRASNIHHRLSELESGLARVDERTRN